MKDFEVTLILPGTRKQTQAVVCVFLAALFAALSHWYLFEFDAIMHVRMGAEILGTGSFLPADNWSATRGEVRWHNFSWLYSTAMYLLSRITGDFSLFPTMRALLVFALTLSLQRLAQPSRMRGESSLAVTAAVCVLAYAAISWRYQLRAELFTLLIFAGLLRLLRSDLVLARKGRFAIGLLLLWANTHAGTAPFGIAIFVWWLLCRQWRLSFKSGGRDLAWSAAFAVAAVLCWLATPLGIGVLKPVLLHASDPAWVTYKAADHMPFELGLFLKTSIAVTAPWAWLLLTAAAVIGIAESRDSEHDPYDDRLFAAGALSVLTALALYRYRACSYQVIFLAPLAYRGLSRVDSRALGVSVCAFLALYAPMHLSQTHPKNSSVSEVEFPVAGSRFLRENGVSGNIFVGTAFAIGAYLLGALPRSHVSLDSRDELYGGYWPELRQIRSDVELKGHLDRYRIDVAVINRYRLPDKSIAFASLELWPAQSWAIVYFDPAAIVLLRRNAAHDALIARYEKRAEACFKAGAPTADCSYAR